MDDYNILDGLCDGLMNGVLLVNNAFKDLLDMKDELMKHCLPHNVILHMSVICSVLFRSISDLNTPVNELVRLVRVYSTTWEEKNISLKKLHQHYEIKQEQLNIAVRRLGLIDSFSRRISREKNILNWVKLFTMITTSQSHGRHWKFHINDIKQKAKLGFEHVMAYAETIKDSADLDLDNIRLRSPVYGSDVAGEGGGVDANTELVHHSPNDCVVNYKPVSNEKDDEKCRSVDEDDIEAVCIKESIEEEEDDKGNACNGDWMPESSYENISLSNASEDQSIESTSFLAFQKKVRFDGDVVTTAKVQTVNSQVSTECPEYERSLFVRIFHPVDVKEHNLIRCTLSCGGQIFKTGVLDDKGDEEEDEIVPEDHFSTYNTRKKHIESDKENDAISEKIERQQRFEGVEIKLPDEIPSGALRLKDCVSDPVNMQIALHHGFYEEMFAMAAINFSDIVKLPLQTVYLPSPTGDDLLPLRLFENKSLIEEGDDLSGSVELHFADDAEHSTHQQELAKDFETVFFPLYPLHVRSSDSLHTPCGSLPLVMFWGKREKPRYFHRMCGTCDVYDLVFELTGIDLTMTSKQDLHKETVDHSTSTDDLLYKEFIPKAEYDRLMAFHQEQLQSLEDQYEQRLQEMMQCVETLQEENSTLLHQCLPRDDVVEHLDFISGRSESQAIVSESPGPVTFHSPVMKECRVGVSHDISDSAVLNGLPVSSLNDDSRETVQPFSAMSKIDFQRRKSAKSNFMIGRRLPIWGENLPHDIITDSKEGYNAIVFAAMFFMRLRHFTEEVKARRRDLVDRTLRKNTDSFEKRLMSQHKLCSPNQQIYDVLKDATLPALFMPLKTGNVFNPRAHQYFHATGSAEFKRSQRPPAFQLPPLLSQCSTLPVMNLFELSRNFYNKGPDWLVEKYQKQHDSMC